MPSTRKQKAKARKSSEMGILSIYGNKGVMLAEGKSNAINMELDSILNCSDRQPEFQCLPNRENSSQENEIRDIDNGNRSIK